MKESTVYGSLSMTFQVVLSVFLRYLDVDFSSNLANGTSIYTLVGDKVSKVTYTYPHKPWIKNN